MNKIHLTVLMAGLSLLPFKSQAQPASFLTNGLIAYYPFNGSVNDASGNGNDGTNYGATPATDRFGKTNAAYYFNGSSWIDLGPVLSNYAVISLSAWINTTYNQGTEGAIVSKPSGPSITGSRLGLTGYLDTGTNNSLDSGFLVSNGIINIVVEDPNFDNNGEWHHGVYVNNGTNVQLFVDGNLVGVQPYSSQNDTSTQPMSIGREWPINNGGGYCLRHAMSVYLTWSNEKCMMKVFNARISPMTKDVPDVFAKGVLRLPTDKYKLGCQRG